MELRIKPVSKGYFKTSCVSIREIAAKRRSGTVIFAERQNPDGSLTKVFLIPEPAKTLRDGKTYSARHMETKRPYGDHNVVFCVSFKFKNGVLHLNGEFPMEVGTMMYSDILEETAVAFQMA